MRDTLFPLNFVYDTSKLIGTVELAWDAYQATSSNESLMWALIKKGTSRIHRPKRVLLHLNILRIARLSGLFYVSIYELYTSRYHGELVTWKQPLYPIKTKANTIDYMLLLL